MGFAEEGDGFFQEAASLIYGKLSEEERTQLLSELLEENIAHIEQLKPRWRFFRLLRFIQIGYMRAQGWAIEVHKILKEKNWSEPDVIIDDVIITDLNNEKMSLSELEKFQPAITDAMLYQLLDKLELKKEYEEYLRSLKARRQSEW
jgi:hypothetical protein